MSNFENNLQNLRANLTAEKQTYESERWNEIRSTTLAEFRKDQERVCNEGIAALQQQRDDAVRQKEEELRNSLKEEIEDTFGQVDVLMRGIGQGRESAVRGLANAGLIVQSITDTTRIPHNGCRPKKVRRV